MSSPASPYWKLVFNCTEYELRDAAAAVESSALSDMRAYFNAQAGTSSFWLNP